MTLIIGDEAPNFELINQFGETVKLSDFRDQKPVVLVFYPLSFSGICTGELCEIRDNFAKFDNENVELLAISVDSKFVQKKFADEEGYKFSVLSDFWPHGAVAKAYGVFLEESGIANRATFVINIEGILTAKFVTAPGQARSQDEYDRALASLQVGVNRD
ncbi:peroxiredoxin [Rhodoluna sp.]|uniref:peroxiredoxin n=1 Tax=Rhodoluna sp. TaxID=1969481 RepID=UPI0025D366C2|nr:peroxiredoxin [Rhodoluna sp.]